MNDIPIADENIFELDKDQLDALRAESGSLPPREQAEYDQMVRELHRTYLKKMSPLLPIHSTDSEMASKFILVNNDVYREFNNNWIDEDGKIVHKYVKDRGAGRAFVDRGNFCILLPVDLWSTISKKHRHRIIKETKSPSENDAKNLVNRSLRTNTLFHEINHLYQDPDGNRLPLWLREAQSYWVGRELADENIQFHTPEFDAIADFYESLVKKYGDDVHKVCFGTQMNSFITYQVLHEFTPEIQQRIFPNYSADAPVNKNA